MNFEILDDKGAVINRIVADQAFVDKVHPGKHRALPEPAPDPKIAILAQLAAIDAETSKPRTVREVELGNADTIAWLESKDAEAKALRAQLKG